MLTATIVSGSRSPQEVKSAPTPSEFYVPSLRLLQSDSFLSDIEKLTLPYVLRVSLSVT